MVVALCLRPPERGKSRFIPPPPTLLSILRPRRSLFPTYLHSLLIPHYSLSYFHSYFRSFFCPHTNSHCPHIQLRPPVPIKIPAWRPARRRTQTQISSRQTRCVRRPMMCPRSLQNETVRTRSIPNVIIDLRARISTTHSQKEGLRSRK